MHVAIVGAGAAGAVAADVLSETGAAVTVFEKSRGLCGRAATRRNGPRTYDYGANYVKSDDDRVTALLDSLGAEGRVDIADPVWTYDREGRIEEGRDDEASKWSYERGLTQIAKRLFARNGATVHRSTRIETVERDGARWWLTDTGDERWGPFDRLLLTPPAPQTAALLRDAEWDAPLKHRLAAAAEAVPYRAIVVGVLGYGFELDVPWYGLVNTDREHPVGWLSREECKPGHVPAGESLLVVQMAPEWSAARFERDHASLVPAIADHAAELLGDDRLRDPLWTDHMGWRYALPDGVADADVLAAAAEYGLFFAGDWVVGEGRIHLALRNGLAVGERIAQGLKT